MEYLIYICERSWLDGDPSSFAPVKEQTCSSFVRFWQGWMDPDLPWSTAKMLLPGWRFKSLHHGILLPFLGKTLVAKGQRQLMNSTISYPYLPNLGFTKKKTPGKQYLVTGCQDG